MEERTADTSRYTIAICVLFIPIFLIGLFGNFMVIVVPVVNPRMRTVTHIFITLLAVGDLIIVCFCMPFTIVSNFILEHWAFDEGMCKMSFFIKQLGVHVSVLTLTAMSAERYFVLLHPLRAKTMWTHRVVLRIAVAIIMVSIIAASPLLYFTKLFAAMRNGTTVFALAHNHDQNSSSFLVCSDATDRHYYTAMTITFGTLFYVIPLGIITCLYMKIGLFLRNDAMSFTAVQTKDTIMKGRQKVIRLLLVLVLTFALCWLPPNILHLLRVTHLSPWTWIYQPEVKPFIFISAVCVYTNTMSNPVLYSFMSSEYRSAFKHLCCLCTSSMVPWTNRPTVRLNQGGSKTISTTAEVYRKNSI